MAPTGTGRAEASRPPGRAGDVAAPHGEEGHTMWVEMKVRGLALDPVSNMPIIILRDEEEKRSLPIWVGIFEANAIALELEKISTPRPMTHDLIKNILESVEAKVEKIVVNDLRDNTFFALIHLRLGEEEITVDSRPSDAIALALRVGAPIFVDDDVVRRAKSVEVAPKESDDQEKLKEWLDNLKPEDFGKYKM
jgi:bifunctional DNase/RNase